MRGACTQMNRDELHMTDSTRTILVIGATGNQGGGLVGHLLASKDWHVRGLTRSPQSEKAQALVRARRRNHGG